MSVLMASQFNFALLCIPEMVNVVFDIQRYHVPQWGFYILFFLLKELQRILVLIIICTHSKYSAIIFHYSMGTDPDKIKQI